MLVRNGVHTEVQLAKASRELISDRMSLTTKKKNWEIPEQLSVKKNIYIYLYSI